MYKKVKGFLVTSTTRNRIVDPTAPGMVMRFEAVLVAESLVKAFEKALADCPSDKEILSLTVAEVNVIIPVTPWDKEEQEAGNA